MFCLALLFLCLIFFDAVSPLKLLNSQNLLYRACCFSLTLLFVDRDKSSTGQCFNNCM